MTSSDATNPQDSFSSSSTDNVIVGGSEMGALIRAFDWSKTPLGSPDTWPQSLRTAVSIMLDSFFPMYIAWGKDYIQLYNDGFRPILGSTKHPAALGISSRETFAESWHMISPLFEGVMNGKATASVDWMVPLDRHGYLEECYFTYSYSPIRQESGEVGGVLVIVSETTDRVLSERRLNTLRELGARIEENSMVKSTFRSAIETLKDNPADIPFALLYLVHQERFELIGNTDLAVNSLIAPLTIVRDDQSKWPLKQVIDAGEAVLINDIEQRFGRFSIGPWSEPITKAIALPIVLLGKTQAHAVLIIGINPRHALDEKYQDFFTLVVRQITNAATNAYAYEVERKRAEAMAIFENVIASISDPLYALDEDWHFIYVNDYALGIWGKTRQELIGQYIWEIFPPVTSNLIKLHSMLNQAVSEQHSLTYEYYSDTLVKGSTHWWEINIYPGNAGVAVYFQDITPRKEAEQLRQRLELVLENVNTGFLILDRNWRYVYANREAAEITTRANGTTREQLLQMTLQEAFPEIVGSYLYNQLKHSMDEQVPSVFDVHLEPYDIWLEYHLYPSSGDLAVFVTDITHRRIEEQERAQLGATLEIERQRIANIIATVPGVIWENQHTDEHQEMKLVFISAYVETMLGYTVDEALAEPHFWAKIFHPQDAAKTTEAFYRVRQSKGSGVINFRAVHKSGRVIDVQALMITILKDDKPVGKRGVMMDVTERQRLVNAQARYATMLRRSNEELQQFAYVASHDLQEPLRMVTSYLQLLESRYSDHLDADAHEFIGYAVDGAARMKALINDLLVYSRVDGGEKVFEEFDVQVALNKALADLALKIEDSHAIITYDPMPSIKADRTQITQLFQNLISNALKFQRGTNVPQIHIGVVRTENEWQFSVQDNGIGIGSQYMDRIFVIFQRLNRKDEYPGTGIGLAICKKVVERHGGRIWVESKVGEWTTFYFTIPA